MTTMGKMHCPSPESEESQLLAILEHRYGDGQVYLPSHVASACMKTIRERGLVNEEGFLTSKGRRFLAERASI